MSNVRDWSTTAASNNSASPDGWPENMAPSGVNDSAREMMASLKEWYDTSYGRNLLINGGMRVSQRGTSFTSTGSANNDDSYTLDRVILLSDGNDVVDVTRDTATVPTGGYASIALDVETANKKFGIFMPIEARDAAAIIGGTASLSFKYRISGTSLTKLRAGIVSWSSTADSITSDIVSAWNAEDTTPTLAANWTFENTPADLTTPTTSFQTARIENVSIDTASTTNVGVFIWIEDTTTTLTDVLYLSEIQLEPGPVATNFEREPYSVTLAKAQRYFERKGGEATAIRVAAGVIQSTTVAVGFMPFSVTMRVSPTISFSSSTAITVQDGASASASTSLAASNITTKSAMLQATNSGAPFTAGNGALFYGSVASDFVDIDSEL